MSEQRKGTVKLDGLDGPRERTFDLPDNFGTLTDAQREAIWRPVKEQLMDDTVGYSVVIPCWNCDCPDEEDCWCEECAL